MRAEKYPPVTLPQCPPEKVLKGQKARVTGAASGVGKAVAVARGPAGAEVVVNYVRERGRGWNSKGRPPRLDPRSRCFQGRPGSGHTSALRYLVFS